MFPFVLWLFQSWKVEYDWVLGLLDPLTLKQDTHTVELTLMTSQSESLLAFKNITNIVIKIKQIRNPWRVRVRSLKGSPFPQTCQQNGVSEDAFKKSP